MSRLTISPDFIGSDRADILQTITDKFNDLAIQVNADGVIDPSGGNELVDSTVTGNTGSSINNNPLTLVHGFYSDSSALKKISDYLKKIGKSIYLIDLIPNDGSIPMEDYAKQLSQFINSNFSPQQSLDLIGFSMGGLVCRYYLQRLGGLKRVQNLVTVACPNKGTLTAYLTWSYACRQMIPGSNFLQDLNSDEYRLNQINCTAIWNPLDFVVLPPKNSKLSAGSNIKIPCIHHSSVTEDERVFVAITKILQPTQNPNQK